MKKNIIILFTLSLFLIPISSFAQNNNQNSSPIPSNIQEILNQQQQNPRELEVKYPEDVKGILQEDVPKTTEIPLQKYLKYIFYFVLTISGLIALGVIIYAGFKYFTSFGNPEKIKDAKNQILNAIVGLVILFISLILLNTLNPQIIGNWVIKITPPNLIITPGIYLCKDEGVMIDSYYYNIKNYNERLRGNKQWKKAFNVWKEKIDENCLFIINESAKIKPDEHKGDRTVYIIQDHTKDERYGAILYSGADFSYIPNQGQQIMWDFGLQNEVSKMSVALNGIGSIRPFILNKDPSINDFVQIFELVDFNKADKNAHSQMVDLSQSYSIFNLFSLGGAGEYYNITDINLPSLPRLNPSLPVVRSVKIQGDLIVIFFKQNFITGLFGTNQERTAEINVFISSDTNLSDDVMGGWCYIPGETVTLPDGTTTRARDEYKPCANQMMVMFGKIL